MHSAAGLLAGSTALQRDLSCHRVCARCRTGLKLPAHPAVSTAAAARQPVQLHQRQSPAASARRSCTAPSRKQQHCRASADDDFSASDDNSGAAGGADWAEREDAYSDDEDMYSSGAAALAAGGFGAGAAAGHAAGPSSDDLLDQGMEWADDDADAGGFGAAAAMGADVGAEEAEEDEEDDPDGLTPEELQQLQEEDRQQMIEDLGGAPARMEDVFGDPAENELEEMRGHMGFTPWDYVEVSEEQLKHEVSVVVDAPLEKCYEVWADRINYCQWFPLIQEMGVIPSDDPEQSERFCQLRIMYRWGQMPTLEIRTILERTACVLQRDEAVIIEEAHQGLPMVGFAVMRRQDMGGRPRTHVTLSFAYCLPVNLKDFVGKVGVYGDVNDKLTASMGMFARFVEVNDLDEIKRVRAEGRALAAEKMEELWATYDRNMAMAEEAVEKGRQDGTLEQQRQAFMAEMEAAEAQDREPWEDLTEAQEAARARRRQVETDMRQEKVDAEDAAEEARTAAAEATAVKARKRQAPKARPSTSTGNPRGRPRKNPQSPVQSDAEDGDVGSGPAASSGGGGGGEASGLDGSATNGVTNGGGGGGGGNADNPGVGP